MARLVPFRERDYADLVDMERRIGRNIEEYAEKRALKGKSGGKNFGGNSGGGSYAKGNNGKSFSKKPYDRPKSGREDGRQNGDTRSVNRSSGNTRRCFKCDETGHIAIDCQGSKQDFSVRCFTCGELGHKLPQCPKKHSVAVSFVGNAPSAANKGKGIATTSGRVFALSKKDAEAMPEVVTGIIHL